MAEAFNMLSGHVMVFIVMTYLAYHSIQRILHRSYQQSLNNIITSNAIDKVAVPILGSYSKRANSTSIIFYSLRYDVRFERK